MRRDEPEAPRVEGLDVFPADRVVFGPESQQLVVRARFSDGTLREVIQTQAGSSGPEAEGTFSATLILGGQVKGAPPRLFMIYPEGNFVEAGDES